MISKKLSSLSIKRSCTFLTFIALNLLWSCYSYKQILSIDNIELEDGIMINFISYSEPEQAVDNFTLKEGDKYALIIVNISNETDLNKNIDLSRTSVSNGLSLNDKRIALSKVRSGFELTGANAKTMSVNAHQTKKAYLYYIVPKEMKVNYFYFNNSHVRLTYGEEKERMF
ncbi:hypothetical protein ACG2LH_07120 [Zhouia sp. PK063]|uniref:hypothetical protein n=1 Tax=Zhouia sp. PK063 TaxID=3373602 RepID=UPI0037B5A4D6